MKMRRMIKLPSYSNVSKLNSAADNNDVIRFKIGNFETPRVLSGFKFEYKNIYTNVNTSQAGVTSQDFVRSQLEISNLTFDFMTIEQYHDMCVAMKVGHAGGNPLGGGSFQMTYFDVFSGQYETRQFIVKSVPATVKCVTGDGNPATGAVNIKYVRIQISGITFQEV